jgi:uncharacterized protein YnzC (UPF0291/DUF896 family)
MTLNEKITRRNVLASLIARHKDTNAERAEYHRLREEIIEIEKEQMK